MLTFWQALRSWFRLSVVRGDRLLSVALVLWLAAFPLASVALGHDRYDCAATGEGTAEECQQHEWRHAHANRSGWALVLRSGYYIGRYYHEKQDVAGMFATFDECFTALHWFGKPEVTGAGAYVILSSAPYARAGCQ